MEDNIQSMENGNLIVIDHSPQYAFFQDQYHPVWKLPDEEHVLEEDGMWVRPDKVCIPVGRDFETLISSKLRERNFNVLNPVDLNQALDFLFLYDIDKIVMSTEVYSDDLATFIDNKRLRKYYGGLQENGQIFYEASQILGIESIVVVPFTQFRPLPKWVDVNFSKIVYKSNDLNDCIRQINLFV